MSATATLTITTMSLPPPTLNLLDANQRTRLIKSTRKLGKVLGTTPYVVESPEFSLPTRSVSRPYTSSYTKESSLQRSRSLSTASFQSNSTIAESDTCLIPAFEKNWKKGQDTSRGTKTRNTPGPSRRHLVQHSTMTLQPLVEPPHPRNQDAARLTPQSLPALVLPSKSQLRLQQELCSPAAQQAIMEPETPLALDSASARRRKMDKLTRHLGEVVPSELVFPHAPCVSENPRPRLQHQYSRSTLEGKENYVSATVGSKKGYERRSRSLSVLIPSAPPTPLRSAFTDEPTELSYFLAYQPEMNKTKTRQERRHGWSGEWNRSDMQDVVKFLRELK